VPTNSKAGPTFINQRRTWATHEKFKIKNRTLKSAGCGTLGKNQGKNGKKDGWLVAPGGGVGAGRGGFGDAVEDLGQVHGVVVEAGIGVGEGRIAIPAVFGTVAVFDFAAVGRTFGGLEKIFKKVDGVV
jgi:hypothetical protein